MDKRVLVVDDSAAVRGCCASVLGRAGFAVDHAASGYEALEKVVQEEKGAVRRGRR